MDEAATFVDGGRLPCLLVESKADCVKEPTADEGLSDFAEKNDFIGSYRASSLTGLNVNESMEALIKEIIRRMEDINSKGQTDVFTVERKSVALDPEQHKEGLRKGQKNNCCK